jgi:hypothetical protein
LLPNKRSRIKKGPSQPWGQNIFLEFATYEVGLFFFNLEKKAECYAGFPLFLIQVLVFITAFRDRSIFIPGGGGF